jgi:hypothetical protein
MASDFLLYSLDSEQSQLALGKLLFSPPLRRHFGPEWTLAWSRDLIDLHLAGKPDECKALYNDLAPRVAAILQGLPAPSVENPPWAMISLDMFVGAIPWVSPIFDRFLLLFLSLNGAVPTPRGKALALAFVASGGPGSTADTAIRICAPGPTTRVSAEHWIMRAFLERPQSGTHLSLVGKDGRHFSQHLYSDASGAQQSIYFETTASWNREQEDFLDFLYDNAPYSTQPSEPGL